ncbi:MAG: protein-L-isoaspartate(D-aspartate) O-methyltransferase [Alphaproteobacteria bacterium]|nr:MAG: protein-L-isoaspartate(D-aspartate) O-methyltransferase [Alphaproteobacteria bacterium]
MSSSLQRIELIMQLRKRGISDTRVLRAMELVPRELFVDPAFVEQAYDDCALPIACGQTISQPYIVAYMTERLAPAPTDVVLEIGTGSGYQTAVLSHLCAHVYTIERYRELQKSADRKFRELGIMNVTTIIGDGWLGWPPKAPYERIIVTAAAEEAPAQLLDQLAEGGRMVLPLGATRETQFLVQIDKTEEGLASEKLLPVRFVPLVKGRVKRK